MKRSSSKQIAVLCNVSTSPVFLDTAEPDVVLNLIKTHHTVPEIRAYAAYRLVPYSECAELGYDGDDNWTLIASNPTSEVTYTHRLVSPNRDVLSSFAYVLSRALPEYQLTLERWDSVRWLMVNGRIIRDFPHVPYCNVQSSDWY